MWGAGSVENARTVENAGSTVENQYGSPVENAESTMEKHVHILKTECYMNKTPTQALTPPARQK